MKNIIIRQLFNLILSVAMASALSGCWQARELNALSITAGIGIDKEEASGNILLTAQIVKPAEIKKPSKESPEGEGTAFWNLRSVGRTVFDAVREATHETSSKLYLAHTQVIILGEDVALDGVRKYLDFFIRSHETRPTAIVMVSRCAASEVLDVKPEIDKLPAINLSKLAKVQELLTSHVLAVNLQEFTASLLSKTTSPIAPLVSVVGENNKMTLHVEGMAIFKGDRLAGILTSAEARGLMWVLGKVKGGDIVVNFPDGDATLEILKAESKVTAEIREDKPYIHIMVKEEANLVNQASSGNLATLPGFSTLEQRQNNVIKSEVQAALKKAKELNADIFGFGDMLRKKHRNTWRLIEPDWDKIFPNLQVAIEVKSSVRGAGLIVKPVAPESVSERE